MRRLTILTISLVLTAFVCSKAVAQDNIALVADNILTSHVSPWEDLFTINNGIDPESSGDKSGGAYGNWTGTDELWNWVEYNWDQLYRISRSDIYWWADGQGILIPNESYQEYWDFQAQAWKPLPNVSGNGVERDQYNITTFDPVLTDRIRVHMVSDIATGILEWKVWGELGEQVPQGTTREIDLPLQKDQTSGVLITARDKQSNVVSGYIFKLDITINNSIATTEEIYNINGEDFTSSVSAYVLPPTSAAGVIAFDISVPSIIDYKDGLSVQVLFNDGITTVGDPFSIFEPGLDPPELTADGTENTVDNDLEISFTDDSDWRNAVTQVYANSEILSIPDDYEISEGMLTLKSSGGHPALTTAGPVEILVAATGYEDAVLTQDILHGTIDPSKSSVRTLQELYRPTNTHIEIIARDAFENVIEGYAFTYDIYVTNNNQATAEVYQVDNSDISGDVTGRETSATNTEGILQLQLKIPREVDINDGIEINFVLQDGTPVSENISFFNDGMDKEIVLQNAVRINAGFSWDRTAQSDNFIVYWGQKIVGDPTDEANGSLSFDPKNILEIMEDLLSYFNDTVKFITNADSLNMARYKHEIVMNETWNSGFTGWAFGGWADEKIGGMWIHPGATNGPAVLAHEFTHMNQCMVFLQYPGYGLNTPYAGFFWESHANFMMKTYTDTYTGVQPERYIFTSMMQFSTTRRHYQNVYFMDYLVDKYGFDTVSDIWRKADPERSHPLTSLRDSVLRYSQDDLNDDIGYHALRNVTWDYSKGDKIRSAINGVDPIYVQRMYTIPDTVAGESGLYIVPQYLAPGDYGYNIIPLFPDEGSGEITIEFSGLDNELAGGAGWRYGFVAVDKGGTARYSTLYSAEEENATFVLSPSDSTIYFVVSGAPNRHHNYAWEPGYPKTFRYPYTFKINGALPAGYKPGYNSQKDIYDGAPHPNGGGWVASTASVDATAWVGPNAQVLGDARIQDYAKIEGFAIVTDDALVRNNAVVRDHAIVGRGSTISNNAIVEKSARVYRNSNISNEAVVTGSALLYGTTLNGSAVAKDLARLSNVTLSGTAIIGGDAEEYNGCSSGTYLQFNRSSCDGQIDYIENKEVNPVWTEYIYPKGENPATPLNLASSDINHNSVTLSWEAAGDFREVESYYLYQDGNIVDIVSGTTTTVSGLIPVSTYSYAVKAVDRSGNVSGLSEIIEITTLVSAVDEMKNNNIMIYPNPVLRDLTIESNSSEPVQYFIKDISGRVIDKGSFKNRTSIEKSTIGPSGFYIVVVDWESGQYISKIAILD